MPIDESEKEKLRIPFWCPVCDVVMRGDQSNETFFRWGCCMRCYIEFVEDREERWRSGWRPTAEVLEQFRKKMSC